MTSAQFDAMFPVDDEDACIAYLVARRWPKGVICPRCGNTKVHPFASGQHWQCEQCAVNGYRFSHLIGTIFEQAAPRLVQDHSPDPGEKKGNERAPAWPLHGIGSVKTAWLMAHKIRTAVIEPEPSLAAL